MNYECIYTIQQIAEITGLSVHTLRYYERIGLIDPVERASSGHRRYSDNDVARVEFLTRLKATGMPLRQMQKYTELIRQGDSTLTERRKILEAHRLVVQAEMGKLQETLDFIETKIERYYNTEQALLTPKSKVS
jgi:DNA-binding transcriptional MerR regulator